MDGYGQGEQRSLAKDATCCSHSGHFPEETPANMIETFLETGASNDSNLPALRSMEFAENRLIIPKKPWSIVLYRKEDGATVLHNPDRRLVSIKQFPGSLMPYKPANSGFEAPIGFRLARPTKACSLCGRPWPENDSEVAGSGEWMNSDYFSLLGTLRSVRSPRIAGPVIKVLSRGDDGSVISLAPPSEADPMNSSTIGNTASGTNQSPYGSVEFPMRCLNQGYYDKFFVQIKRLGKGQRGSVFLCNHVRYFVVSPHVLARSRILKPL